MEVVAHDHIGGSLGERKGFRGNTRFQNDPQAQTRFLRQREKDFFKGKEQLPQAPVLSDFFVVDLDSVKSVFPGHCDQRPGVRLRLLGGQDALEDSGVLLDGCFTLGYVVDNGQIDRFLRPGIAVAKSLKGFQRLLGKEQGSVPEIRGKQADGFDSVGGPADHSHGLLTVPVDAPHRKGAIFLCFRGRRRGRGDGGASRGGTARQQAAQRQNPEDHFFFHPKTPVTDFG